MHIGHVELLNRAKRHAKMTNSKVALFTFSNNHLAVLKKDNTVVYTYEERLSLYDSLGVDYVIAAAFDEDFKKLRGKEFLTQLNKYNLESVVCGFDYCCGSDRLDASGVRDFLKDIPVYITEQVCVDGEKVSTSLIRSCLIDRKIEKVNSLLSEEFFAVGMVVHGRGVGKTLGFPTANIRLPAEKLLPNGVFGGKTTIECVTYPVIVNIGKAPTFDVIQNTFETHVINYKGDLYNKELKISLSKFLRPDIKFDSPEELVRQLQLDKESVLHD